MSNIDQVIQAAGNLLVEGRHLDYEKMPHKDLGSLNIAYQRWYTQALAVVTQLTPARAADFAEAYKYNRRRAIQYDTYTISDFLMGVTVTRGGTPCFDINQAYMVKLVKQIGILSSALEAAPSVLQDIRAVLHTELLDEDIDCASKLSKSGHLRSAGVVCGVVLEKHLKDVIVRRHITTQTDPISIGNANDLLKENSVYDITTWHLIQRLADIRDLCAQSTEREPTKDEVEDLIAGTMKVTKEVF